MHGIDSVFALALAWEYGFFISFQVVKGVD
jgi:hypothetical protein